MFVKVYANAWGDWPLPCGNQIRTALGFEVTGFEVTGQIAMLGVTSAQLPSPKGPAHARPRAAKRVHLASSVRGFDSHPSCSLPKPVVHATLRNFERRSRAGVGRPARATCQAQIDPL
jgi:hypothetical protein